MKRSSSPSSGIRVIARRAGGRIHELAISGHAGFAPHGRDIVCSAVSALVQSAAYGITVHCGAQAQVSDDRDGAYRLRVARGGNAKAQAILESALSGLRAIARAYPRALRVREVAGNRAPAAKRSGPVRTR